MANETKIIIGVLLVLLIICASLFAYEKFKDWKQEQYDLGFEAGQANGRIEGWTSLIDDLCYDGLVTLGVNNETGKIVQRQLSEVCGK